MASTIEHFRLRFHKGSTLRLLSLGATGQVLLMSRELSRGFYIGREFDSTVGVYTSMLTIDTNLNDATETDILNTQYVDLVAEGGAFQRFKLASATPPQKTAERYVASLEAAFNNALPIDGVIVFNPESSPASIFSGFIRHTYEQVVPSVEWIVNHNLGVHPMVQVYGSDGYLLEAEVQHVSLNQFRVYSALPVTGIAQYI